MSKLCVRPGCSNEGAAVYGMVPEDLLFWIAPISAASAPDQNVLCRRHADAMSVPRGWTLDDRREEVPRLFMAGRFESDEPSPTRAKRAQRSARTGSGEQLVIDGTGEIERPDVEPLPQSPAAAPAPADDTEPAGADVVPAPWTPAFDHDDDLDGLLETDSPLLSRAFRGAERRTS